MPKRREHITVEIQLEYDSRKEDRAGVLAATFASMAEGFANGQAKGPLPNDGHWTVRNGREMLRSK